jgi:RNA polymerase sigma-70 factor (ECF subfamily)
MIRNGSPDEEEIIRQCQAGDRDRFSVLVERYKTMTYTVAYRMLGDADSANDAAQDAFIAAYLSLREFRGGAKFSTWLYRIVMNKCRDQLRADRHHVPIDEIADVRPDPARTPEQAAAGRETRDRVQAALDALQPDYREVLVLKHIQGLAFEEIAEITGAGIPALKVRAHRGREMLRAAMERAENSHAERP